MAKNQPAFPVLTNQIDGKIVGAQTGSVSGFELGLTKRELIAAMAMQGYIASYVGTELCNPDDAAKRGVEYADALLVELEKATT